MRGGRVYQREGRVFGKWRGERAGGGGKGNGNGPFEKAAEGSGAKGSFKFVFQCLPIAVFVCKCVTFKTIHMTRVK